MNDPLFPSRTARAAAVVPAAWLAAFFAAPLVAMLVTFVRLDDVVRVASRDSTWRVAWFSAWQAAVSVAATFVVAAPVTWLVGRHDFRGRRALRAVSTVGFLLPSVVVAAAFLALLPRSWQYTPWAVVLAHAYFNVAVVVRVVGARLESFDDRQTAAARTLGAAPAYAAGSIAWPFVRGAVAAAAGIVFIYCFTSYAVVRLLGGPQRNTLESDIALRAFGIGDIPAATVLSVVQVLMILLAVYALRVAAGGDAVAARAARVVLAPVAAHRRWIAALTAAVTVVFVSTPLVAVFWKSLRVGDQMSLAAWRAVSGGDVASSIVASLRTALVAGIIGTVLAAATTLAVVRLGTGGRWLDAASIVPLAVSPVTLGLGLVITFDSGWLDWRANWWFVAVAHTLVAFPLAVRVLLPAWRAVPRGLHAAAAVLGASDRRRIVDVDLRLARRGLVAALGLVVAVSLGEFGAASLLSRRGTETMPVAVSRLLERTGDTVRAQAFVLATVLVIACVAALFVVELALGRSRRAARR